MPVWNIAPTKWVNSLTASLPPAEMEMARLDLQNILAAAARVAQWTPTKTDVIQSEYVDPSGAVRMDGAGVHVYNGLAETIWLKSIGDVFIGTNITAAASTHFVFLSTAQTYNSESLGAGDLLVGDNSSSKANMLWDASAGILYFRGGTTNQAYIDTSGALTAGAGAVTLTAASGIVATLGTIGGWSIGATSITDAAALVGMSSAVTGGDDIRFWAGNTTPASAAFRVTEAGALVASSATITGSITATSGTIGGWTIDSTSIQKLTANVGVKILSSTPEIQVGNTAGTYIQLDGANQRIRSSNYSAGASGFDIAAASGDAEFNSVTVRGNMKAAVFEKDTISAVGGWLAVLDADVLDTDMTAADNSTLTIEGNTTFAINDILRIKDGVDDEWLLVTNIGSAPTYTVTRDQAAAYGAGANPAWKHGVSVVNYGASGEGGVVSFGSGTPEFYIFTHAGAPWTTLTKHVDFVPTLSKFGSNVAAAATTAIAILHSAQTYNSESLGAGDVLVGDNSANKANMLWDASAGILYFRGGTTNQVYIDTTGALTCGGGVITLDADGIRLGIPISDENEITWECAHGTGLSYISGIQRTSGTKHTLDIEVFAGAEIGATAADVPSVDLRSRADSGEEAVLSVGGGEFTGAGVAMVTYNAASAWTASVHMTSGNLVINDNGLDMDSRIEGDTATNLFITDAGLDAVQIGTTTAGAIADFRAATIVFNEASADIDFRVESNGNANMLFVDGGTDRIGIGTAAPLVLFHLESALPDMIMRATDADADNEIWDWYVNAGAGYSQLNFRVINDAITVANSWLWVSRSGASPTEVVFNQDSVDCDFRVESNGNANMLFVDGGADRVGIGTAAPDCALHILGDATPDTENIALAVSSSTDKTERITIGWNITGHYGTIQAVDSGVAVKTLALQSIGGGVVIGGTTPQANYELTVNNDIYAVGDVSALTFTDRTDYPESLVEAYRAVKSVAGKGGKLDHEKLDPFVKGRDGRNLSALVSAQAEVIKDLVSRIEVLEET